MEKTITNNDNKIYKVEWNFETVNIVKYDVTKQEILARD